MISTYQDLVGEISDMLASEELASKAPNFIQMAESSFNRVLDTLAQETRARHYPEAGTDRITIPNDFSGVRTLRLIAGGQKYRLTYMTPEQMVEEYGKGSAGQPKNFTIEGVEIVLAPVPDATYTIEAIYSRDLRPLAEDSASSSNWLLRQAPDIYLYQSLIQAEAYLHNDERIGTWKALADGAIAQLLKWDRNNRFPADVATRHDYGTDPPSHG